MGRSNQSSFTRSKQQDGHCDVLLLCVNDHEINEIFKVFKEKGCQAKPFSLPGFKLTFHDFGIVNEARILCLQTNMGSIGQGATAADVHQAFKEVRPKYIIAVGIAFGMDESKQSIGEILLSKRVALYDFAKKTIKNGEKSTIRRGSITDIPQVIFNKFRAAIPYWSGEKVNQGLLLTGEKLINDPDFKNSLSDSFPEAIGGEMEAAGLYCASTYEKNEWIVVKAICDYADGQKDKDKESRQQIAANNAASFVFFTLNKFSFKRNSGEEFGEYFPSSIPVNSTYISNNIERNCIDKVQNYPIEPVDTSVPLASQPQLFEDPLHTQTTFSLLRKLLRRRVLPGCKTKQEIQNLVNRIEKGDLCFASKNSKLDVYLWAARILAAESEHLDLVKDFLSKGLLIFPDCKNDRLAVIEALMEYAKGNLQNCLDGLSDIDTPDSRSNIMFFLAKQKGQSFAIDWFNTFQPVEVSLLSPVGWLNAAAFFAQNGHWEEAINLLSELPGETLNECPEITYSLGILHAGCLLPLSHRQHLLAEQFVGLVSEAQEGNVAKFHRDQATVHFKQAKTLMNELDAVNRAEGCEYWLMWLRLTDPKEKRKAIQELVEAMKDGKKAVLLIEFSLRFKVDFDYTPLKNYLHRCKLEKTLSSSEHSAQLMLLQHQGATSDVIKYLSEENSSLSNVYSPAILASSYINALINDGRIADAKKELEQRMDVFNPKELKRLRLMIEGNKVKKLSKLTALFEETGDYLDLQYLVAYLRKTNQWESLLPKAKLLLEQHRSADNACQVVEAMRCTHKTNEDVLRFIIKNEDLATVETEIGAKFLGYKAWELFFSGQFIIAKNIVEILVTRYHKPEDIALEINIALRMGKWERFAEIVEREYSRRSTFPPTLLIQMASVVAERVDDRAMDLLMVATEKAANDANLQSHAYILASQIGRETEAGNWLKRTIQLTEKGKGSGKRIGLDEMVEMMPARIEENRLRVRKFMTGALPIHAVPGLLNSSFAQILIGNALLNESQQDPRLRFLIPIRHGSRALSKPPEFKRLVLDVTSLLILEHIGFIEVVFSYVDVILLSPRVMDVLFEEYRKVRFHQPSQVSRAERIHKLITDGAIRLLQNNKPPKLLIEEVGFEMASLLHAAQIRNGRVVAALPIYKSGSMNREIADLKNYAPLVLKTSQFLKDLEDDLDPDIFTIASSYLSSVDRGDPIGLDCLGEGPVYIDDLALNYLDTAGILESGTRLENEFFVTELVDSESKSLIGQCKHGEKIAKVIDQLRKKLRDAISIGKIQFLKQAHAHDALNSDTTWQMNLLLDAFSGLSDCDAVCVDDRLMGKHLKFEVPGAPSVPNIGIYDIINKLNVNKIISNEDKKKALWRLRKQNFVFIPVCRDEVFDAVKSQVSANEETFKENRDLKAIRENILSVRSNQILCFPDESFWVDQLSQEGLLLLIKIWQDNEISLQLTIQVSDWVLDVMLPMPHNWTNSAICKSEPDSFNLLVNYLFRIVNILYLVSLPTRRSSFASWIENRLIQPMLRANENIIDELSRIMGEQIVILIRKVANAHDA